jgi:hypothetical protein
VAVFEIVNVVMTCNSVDLDALKKYPQRVVKTGLQIVAPHFTVIIHSSGRAKVFCKSLEPPLPHFSDCRINNIVVRTTMRAIPEEELIEKLREHGAVDRAEKKSAVLFYVRSPTEPSIITTVRIFVKPSERYKAIMFSKSIQELRRVAELLQTL